MKVKKYKAYWHAWHEPYLIYFLTDAEYRKRIEEIKATKPPHEIPTRLRLFKEVRGKILRALKQAWTKWKEAYAEWGEAVAKRDKAVAKWDEAYAKCEEAETKCKEAETKCEEVYEKFLPLIEKLHGEECGCKEWNGKEIVFPKMGSE